MTFDPSRPTPAEKIRDFPSFVTTNEWPRLKANIQGDHFFQDTAGGSPDPTGYHTVIHLYPQATPANLAGYSQKYGKLVNANVRPQFVYSTFPQEQIYSVNHAVGRFLGTNVAGACTAVGGTHNIACTRTATLGLYTADWTANPLPDTNYIPNIFVVDVNSSGIEIHSLTTTSITFKFLGALGYFDPTSFCVSITYIPPN